MVFWIDRCFLPPSFWFFFYFCLSIYNVDSLYSNQSISLERLCINGTRLLPFNVEYGFLVDQSVFSHFPVKELLLGGEVGAEK